MGLFYSRKQNGWQGNEIRNHLSSPFADETDMYFLKTSAKNYCTSQRNLAQFKNHCGPCLNSIWKSRKHFQTKQPKAFSKWRLELVSSVRNWMGPEDLIITHLIKFSLAKVSDEIFNVFNGFDIGITNLYWIQNILISLFNGESYSIRWAKIIILF